MPAEQIARNLAFINWTVLAGLAAGAISAVALLRLGTDATKGYLGFTALCAAAFAALAWISDGGLPAATLAGSPVIIDPAWELPRQILLAVEALLALAASIALFRGRRAALLLVAGSLVGLGTLVAGALGWGGDLVGAVPLAIQLVVLGAATGGVFAAMILGHWYLVTPRLSIQPAILLTRVLCAVVGLQLALFVAWVGFGAGQNLPPFAPLAGPWALFVWLRLAIGLVFPLVITWAALQTVRSRSMESATGLLYIAVGAIASGTVLAAGLYFGAGLLV